MIPPPIALPADAVLLLGPTGSGKSPLGDLIAARGFLGKRSHHLDFGSELRSIASGIGSSSYSREEKDFINGVLTDGFLLENEHFSLARKIISLFLERSRFRTGEVLVLNGIPRHVGQAVDVSTVARVHALVVLECSVASVISRIEENTGGDRTCREDDSLRMIDKKIRIFVERTAPLIGYYESSGSCIYRIVVNEQTTTVSAYHQLSALSTADPPVSLVAEPPHR